MRDKSTWRVALLATIWICCALVPACHGERTQNPNAEGFRRLIVMFVDAATRGDTAALTDLAFDQRALIDAERLKANHMRILRPPEHTIGVPHYVASWGDTAVAVLYAGGNPDNELGTEFRRVRGSWKVARIGLSPR